MHCFAATELERLFAVSYLQKPGKEALKSATDAFLENTRLLPQLSSSATLLRDIVELIKNGDGLPEASPGFSFKRFLMTAKNLVKLSDRPEEASVFGVIVTSCYSSITVPKELVTNFMGITGTKPNATAAARKREREFMEKVKQSMMIDWQPSGSALPTESAGEFEKSAGFETDSQFTTKTDAGADESSAEARPGGDDIPAVDTGADAADVNVVFAKRNKVSP